jgi:HSP20 family protein
MSTKDLVRKRETLPSIFNDFFRPWESLFDFNGGGLPGNLRPSHIPAVNIVEQKDSYEVSLAAPGMKKDDFNIDVEGSTLFISAEKKKRRKKKTKSTHARSLTILHSPAALRSRLLGLMV